MAASQRLPQPVAARLLRRGPVHQLRRRCKQPLTVLPLGQAAGESFRSWAEERLTAAAEQEDEPLQVGAQLADAVNGVAHALFQEAAKPAETTDGGVRRGARMNYDTRGTFAAGRRTEGS
jgi:hypothetical protein